MLEVEIGGVAEAFANLTERGAVDPVVKATLTLSDSGFVAVKDAVAYGEIKDESLTGKYPCSLFFGTKPDADLSGKLKGLFGGGASSSDEATAESADNTPPRDSESSSASAASSSSSASASSAAAAEKETKKAAAPVENTIPLSLEVTFPTIPPMTVEQKKTSRSRFGLLSLHMLTHIYYVIYFPPLDCAPLTRKSSPKPVARKQGTPLRAISTACAICSMMITKTRHSRSAHSLAKETPSLRNSMRASCGCLIGEI